MSLFTSLIGVKANQLHDTLNKTIVTIDPKGASEAQIQEYIKNVDILANLAATAKAQAMADNEKVNKLQVDLDRHIAAVKMPNVKPEVLETLLNDADKIKSNLNLAKSAYSSSSAYADRSVQTHSQAAQKLVEARNHLQEAMQAQQEAQQDANLAKQRKHDAEVAAGIISGGGNSLDTALNAMTAHTAELKKQTDAANMTIGAIVPSSTSDVEAALAAVDAKPVPQTLEERLASLQA
jgi:hypothetical protein